LRAFARLAGRLVAAIFLFAVAASVVHARQSSPAPGPPADRDPMREFRERQQREANLRSLGPTAARNETLDPRRAQAAAEHISQDFKQIQVLRNEMVRALKSESPLDYKVISDKAGEINKRANRLKSYLLPPPAKSDEREQKAQGEPGQTHMKDALVALCKRIESFVDNPVFKEPGTVDVKQSAKAGGDLLSIIELSGDIRKTAEKLNKTPH
jgi:hypothetical protein